MDAWPRLLLLLLVVVVVGDEQGLSSCPPVMGDGSSGMRMDGLDAHTHTPTGMPFRHVGAVPIHVVAA